MPASAGSSRPPDPSEIIARSKGGGRVAPGSRAATAHGDPTTIFNKYASAADPQWEQYQDRMGNGVPPVAVMGLIDLMGDDPKGDSLLAMGDLMGVDPDYDVIAFDEAGYGLTPGEYFADEASAYLEDEGFYTGRGYRYTSGNPPDTSLISSVGTAPADITYAPTSTTNPERPRTVAAGWDSRRKVMTVVFRDGTFYNYYQVVAREWNNFKNSRSKGRYINAYLNAKPRGAAAMGSVPEAHQELLYKVARTSQVMRGGYTGKQKYGSKRGTGGKYAYGESGSVRSGGRVYRRAKAAGK